MKKALLTLSLLMISINAFSIDYNGTLRYSVYWNSSSVEGPSIRSAWNDNNPGSLIFIAAANKNEAINKAKNLLGVWKGYTFSAKVGSASDGSSIYSYVKDPEIVGVSICKDGYKNECELSCFVGNVSNPSLDETCE